MNLEPKPVADQAGMTAWMAKVKSEKPQAVLAMLQHMSCWSWIDQIAKQGIPTIVFAPVGTAFTGHIDHGSRLPGVHVISSLEWPAVEDALRMVRAKRMFEETRVLHIHSDKRNETVMERLGMKVRAIPRDTFNQLFDQQTANAEVKDVAADLRNRAQDRGAGRKRYHQCRPLLRHG